MTSRYSLLFSFLHSFPSFFPRLQYVQRQQKINLNNIDRASATLLFAKNQQHTRRKENHLQYGYKLSWW